METLNNIWSSLPSNAMYIAMDDDGIWYWYNQKPTKDYQYNCWVVDRFGQDTGLIKSSLPEAKDWAESLIKRP